MFSREKFSVPFGENDRSLIILLKVHSTLFVIVSTVAIRSVETFRFSFFISDHKLAKLKGSGEVKISFIIIHVTLKKRKKFGEKNICTPQCVFGEL